MEFIKIGANLTKDKVDEIIRSNPFSSKLQFKKESYKDCEFLIFNIDKHRLDEANQLNYLTKLVQNIIIKCYMPKLIEDKLFSMLIDYTTDDVDYLSIEISNNLHDDFSFIEEKKKINEEILDYLLENNTLILDGYLRFRSKSFDRLLDKIIDKIIIDIQRENEYEDFIEMLQYYLETQLPKVETINVVINKDEFILLDERKRPLESESVNALAREYEMDDVSKADILVSSLIVLAPDRVVVHLKNDKEKELMQILKRIFSDKLTFCYSCEMCDLNITKADE